MKKIKKASIILLVFLCLYGCNDTNKVLPVENIEKRSPVNDPVNITIDEANKIALKQAESEGIDSAALWEENSTKITTVYSVKHDRDIKVYEVNMSVEDDFFGVFYYVSTENGEIITIND